MTTIAAVYLDMLRQIPDAIRDVVRSQITALFNATNPDKASPVDPFRGKRPPD